MNFKNFLMMSLVLCMQFVVRIAFSAVFGWFIDKYFGIFPLATVALTGFGGYLGFKALIAVRDRKYDDA